MCDGEYFIDNSWIEEFDELDKEYAQYYTEDLSYINLRCVYINRLNEIEQIRGLPVQLNLSNRISRDELIGILKRNMQLPHKKYTVLSMLKYNIDIEPQNIKHLVDVVDHYLTHISNIDDITFNKSIPIFHPLNELIILFYEKMDKGGEGTGLGTGTGTGSGTGSGSGTGTEIGRQTKKIYIRVNKNKTRSGSRIGSGL